METIRLERSLAEAILRFLGKCHEASRFFEVCQGPSYRRFVTNAMEDPVLEKAYIQLRDCLRAPKATGAKEPEAAAGDVKGQGKKRSKQQKTRTSEVSAADTNEPEVKVSEMKAPEMDTSEMNVSEMNASEMETERTPEEPDDGAMQQDAPVPVLTDAAGQPMEADAPDADADVEYTPEQQDSGDHDSDGPYASGMDAILERAIGMDAVLDNV